MHPLAPVKPLLEILLSLSGEIFCQNAAEIFLVDERSCERIPLLASLVNFAFCVGAFYSDDYNERIATLLYENGKRYFLRSNSLSLFSPVKAMVIFIWVDDVQGLH